MLASSSRAGLAHFGQEPPPADMQQQRVLQTVTEFAHDYQEHIPNFTCIRSTQHLVAPSATKQWRSEAKTAYELSFYEHEEALSFLLTVDDISE